MVLKDEILLSVMDLGQKTNFGINFIFFNYHHTDGIYITNMRNLILRKMKYL